ncbi:MAG: trypsin-like peptidase domain-containing protein [Verrucomicrobiales bacterium]|jgi:S1-C subfamily serine protease|nr:trypsin-like peptidase domain-containing protein [Verrucomicrobiales bacterium]MBP9222937.1 trypsin-like peptidase domain-containing protein [Verrucomicrobiales bacterium]HQZ27338.1 serine protease [Verrucomicrobiales bacterium]
MIRLPLGLLLLPFLLFPAREACSQDLPSPLVERARKASVEVLIRGQLRGGGALIANGEGRIFVITAAHLFRSPTDTCSVVTLDDRIHPASLSAYDLGHDLALLEVDPEMKDYGNLAIASKTPSETTSVFNLGPALSRRTLFLPGSVAQSRISFTDFSVSKDYLEHYFIAGINPAFSSGGPWINRSGEIVGIQHGRLKGDEGAPSSGLSMVSTPEAIRMLVKSNAVAATPGIGAYLWETRAADYAFRDKLPEGIEGIYANPVFDGRPLATAGIKPNEIILTCNDEATTRTGTFLTLIRSKPVGTAFSLKVFSTSSGKTRQVTLTTGSLEALWR